MAYFQDVVLRLRSYTENVRKKRVLLAESHPLFRQAIIDVLTETPGIDLVAKAANGWDALRMSHRLNPDVILIDFHMAGLSGLEVTKLVMRESPQVFVVVLLDEENEQYIKAVEKSGAWAQLTKSQLAQELPYLLTKLQRADKASDIPDRTLTQAANGE